MMTWEKTRWLPTKNVLELPRSSDGPTPRQEHSGFFRVCPSHRQRNESDLCMGTRIVDFLILKLPQSAELKIGKELRTNLQIFLSSDATTSKSRSSTNMDLNKEMLLVCSDAEGI